MREDKQLLLDEINDQLGHYDAFLIMRYFGLDANTTGDFRREVAESGGNIEVVKKRILLKAAQTSGIEITEEMLEGHIGLVFTGEDPIQTAKTVFKYSKDTDKAVEVLGGHLDGQLYSAEQMETLSKLPGKDEMRAQLLSVLVAPMQQTVGTMQSVMTSILYCLENKAKKEES